MRRKLIRQRDSFTITLPKGWVGSSGADKESEVDLIEEEGKLVISTAGSANNYKKEARVKLDSDNWQHIKAVVSSAYRIGYDSIILECKSEKQFAIVEEVLKETLLGYEITERKGNTCRIESIAEPSFDKIDSLLRKLFYIIIDSAKAIEGHCTNGAKISAVHFKEQKDKADQYAYFCMRMVAKSRRDDKSYLRWSMFTYLLLIQHGFLRLAQALSDKREKGASLKGMPLKAVVSLSPELSKLCHLLYDSYIKQDLNGFAELNEISESMLYGKCYEILDSGKGSSAAYHMAEIIRLVHLCRVPCVGMIVSFGK